MELELYDKTSERAVLAGIFSYGVDAFIDVDDILNSESFFIDSNQAIYKCLKHSLQNGVDKPDVATILSSAKSINLGLFFESDQELKHLRSIINMPVEKDNVRKLAGKIRKLEITRKYIEQLQLSIEELRGLTGEESIDQILSIPEGRLLEFSNLLSKDKTSGPELVSQDIDAWVEYLAQNQVEQIGIKTPFKAFDEAIGGGLRPATVNVIGARAKGGKTAWGITCANHFAQNNIPCFYADSEMSKDDHRMRSLAMLSGVWITEIENGQFANNKEKFKKVNEAARQMKEASYEMMSIAGQPFEDTISVMRRWVTNKVGFKPNGKAKDCVIIFDYLKLMSSGGLSKHLQEYQALGFMMTGLHNFAVKYGVPILLFTQLNRDGIDAENSTAVSGSDRIIWLCSNFSIYKKLSDSEMASQAGSKNKYNRKLIISESRHGKGLEPDHFIAINANMNCFQIKEVGIKSSEQTSNDDEPIRFG